jgi:hypothetical protein
MPYFLRTILNPLHRKELFDRLEGLDPSQAALWGRMTAPSMLIHLCDQMRMPFNDNPSGRIPGVPRHAILRQLILYFLPWPKGTIQGPPEAFHTKPGNWSGDLATLNELVDQFVNAPPDRHWPDQPNFGPMSRRDWGVFCYRHFDHHLRQFGV